ncbi:hypothetical protein [Amycolatopsis alba]|nr:hypothetical protein [Amycolatopsis alba]
MDVDAMFTGDLVLSVPSTEGLYAPKMPGDADGNDKGDHCAG